MAQDDVFKRIVAHCKEYGFVFPSSEIYDGLGAVYDYGQMGVELKNNIDKYFWDDEKKAYIDSYQSGNRTVNRHANIFALLFGIANEKKRSLIIENVI